MSNWNTPNEFSCAVIKENIYHADQNNCKNIKSPHVVIDAIFFNQFSTFVAQKQLVFAQYYIESCKRLHKLKIVSRTSNFI